MATPFKVDWSDEAFDALKARVRSYRLPDQPDDSDWSYGCDPQTLRELCAYWVDRYDVDAMVRDLNCFPQFTMEIDGLRLHFVHVRGEAEGKRPLLLIHGWPGSTYEFWPAVEALAFPSRNGGRAEDAFDLVVPSLPGYGFSAKPNQPISPRRIGALFNALMREVLGYDRYLVHGTDWGVVIGPWMALDQANSIRGLHIDYLGTVPEDAPQDDTERRWMQQFADYEKRLGAYSHLQSTRVQSLAYAMHNNPVAQAAWLLERFHDWADLGERYGGRHRAGIGLPAISTCLPSIVQVEGNSRQICRFWGGISRQFAALESTAMTARCINRFSRHRPGEPRRYPQAPAVPLSIVV
ncbi:Epoxide hydrolase domain protein (plasmid) [Neorhizobium galegae bv. officinalis bv. officinalis str. HAMBI 1141]|uniref:Epoxide hydrolase domain protein n=1 Tax=Neorhizobium galegae bv. officinalis bv. officinalis str. HAMBI 1141 TaxID=1028801 RepID=A0A068THL2_NEOGA|nr:epoxide hydrolase family protein [Neorhizobium galegae]CDN57897.1 Epoxide hydrolase domain protein [Neorhizobium galegae bv. officinalis bv. officinalis str. HAMBI 1141]